MELDALSEVRKAVQPSLNHAMQPSWNHAFVTFNNQNSVLMSMFVPTNKLSCLLHDNRIFAFKGRQASDDASSLSNEQNLLLNLLTTPKYRAMSAMYLIFRLFDNISLLLLIVLNIMDVGFTIPTPAQAALLSAIGLEVFYDVMLYTHKYWILQRLSIYIGILLYCFYAGFVALKNSHGEYTPHDLCIVISVLTSRFVAFIFEECVDIAIDGELHNDLLKLKKNAEQNEEKNDEISVDLGQNPEQDESQPLLGEQTHSSLLKSIWIWLKSIWIWLKSIWIWFESYMDVSITVKMPQNVYYRGSFFAWSAYSVFTEEVWTEDPFPSWLVIVLCILPFIVAFALSTFLILLCLVAALIPVMLTYIIAAIYNCTCERRKLKEKVMSSNFWKELTHF